MTRVAVSRAGRHLDPIRLLADPNPQQLIDKSGTHWPQFVELLGDRAGSDPLLPATMRVAVPAVSESPVANRQNVPEHSASRSCRGDSLKASAWAWKRNPAWGFVSAWFLLILAPSSILIPLLGPIYEHHIYLSLAVVVSLVVTGLYSVAGRQSLAVFIVVAIRLGYLTWWRNQDYRSEVAFWRDAVAKFPDGALRHDNLGVALERAGRVQAAIEQYEQALQLHPNLADVHSNLGVALELSGRPPERDRAP